jgi:hypothetical protein
MAKVKIHSGSCGFVTTVEAKMEGNTCTLSFDSECEAIRSLAGELTEVDPFQEISFRAKGLKLWNWGQNIAITPPARCRSASSRQLR